MTKIDELVAVLDMPEEKQVEFFYIKGHRQLVDTFPAGGLRIKYGKNNEIVEVKHSQSKLRFDRRALADLAFRLRDESVEKHGAEFHNGIYAVQCYLKKEEWATAFWGEMYAQPIHWIIAALIAKELARKELTEC